MNPKALVASALAALLTLAAITPVAASRPAVRLENGVLINSRAGYRFDMPQGWALDGASDYEDVKVSHSGSGAVFSVHYDRARGTPTMYYMALVSSLESPDRHWLSFGKGQVKLGGRDVMGLRGTREKEGKTIKELFWVALVDEYVYLLSTTIDADKFDQRAPEIDLIFTSFSWGAP